MGYNTSIFPGGAETAVQPATVVPSATWQMLSSQVRTESLPQDMDAIWDGTKGYMSRLKYRTGRYLGRARQVLAYENVYKDLSDARLARRPSIFAPSSAPAAIKMRTCSKASPSSAKSHGAPARKNIISCRLPAAWRWSMAASPKWRPAKAKPSPHL